MARNETITIAAEDWAQMTNADITAISFQNHGPGALWVVATTTATEPSDTDGCIRYKPGQGEANAGLSDLFPGVSSAVRVYAYAETDSCRVLVSHA